MRISNKKIGIKQCLTGHCYCRLLNNGVMYCCKCGKWEEEPELKVSKSKNKT